MKQEEYFGFDAVENLEGVVKGYSEVLLVTGKGSYEGCGAREEIEGQIENLTRFCGFGVNPKVEDVERGCKNYGDYGLVIAVGGGSVIDMGKSISTLARQDGEARDYVTGKRGIDRSKNIPFVAIPTTAGSGSEATHFAVVYVNGVKHSLADDSMLPDVSIVDPNFLRSLGGYQRACTSFDALSQGIESCWSRNSIGESRRDSLDSVKHIVESIERYVQGDNSDIVLENMARGSNLAGQAINVAKTTGAHALSYGFTQFEIFPGQGIPHGHGVALTLPEFFRFNIDGVNNRWIRLLGMVGGYEGLIGLRRSVGLESISELIEKDVFDEDDLVRIVDNVNVDRSGNNPRDVSKDDLMKIVGL